MTHRFPIKEIARQAGVGPATVDRVLNDRPNVSHQTRNRVRAAMDELAGQEAQLSARGRRLFVDFIVEAPGRFSTEVRRAAERVLPEIGAGVIRPRFTFQDVMTEKEIVAALERVRRRGSDGLCLKARDLGPVRDKVAELEAAGIPVITLVTDLPTSPRTAYVGLDNANAGRVAAMLLSMAMGGRGKVLTVRSQDDFQGETERFAAFRAALPPDMAILDLAGGAGLALETRRRLEALLRNTARIDGVYSMGGGNAMILQVLHDAGHTALPFVAHDLDAENRALLAKGLVTFVLHHNLADDMRALYRTIAATHGLTPPYTASGLSDVQIITAHNVPG